MKAFQPTLRPLLTACALAVLATTVQANERESLESLRQTTLSLIEVLVQSGVLTRDKADTLLREAQAKAQQALAQQPAPGASPAEATAGGKPVQRVPYISESARQQLRNEVKEEVLAQARQERWGVPNAPSWTDRIRIDGDIRYRHQTDRPDKGNTPADRYVGAFLNYEGRMMRMPEFADSFVALNEDVPYTDTAEARNRERIRLRLGVTAKVTDEVGVGVRLATGNGTDRVSTNQTMGQNFNKYQLFVDRAFLRLDPAEWVSVQAGRIPNPWFSTEMVWSDSLNFEGVASTVRWPSADGRFVPFATLGWFPLREKTPAQRESRSLTGAQVGAQWDVSSRTKLKFGLAYYTYHNVEGREDLNYDYGLDTSNNLIVVPNSAHYGGYEYERGLRQRGNTLFETQPMESGDPIYGLAYRFRPVVLTVAAEFSHFMPFSLMITGEYVKNTAFSASDFLRRAGPSFAGVDPGGKDDGYHLKMAFGAPDVREQGQWQVSASYRRVGSDAVLDAFTDSDLNLGGTNVEGYTLGLAYGLYRNTSLGVRYLSGKSMDSTINSNVDGRYNVNTLQVDLNVRF